MAITINDKTYRNLEEQVLKNKEDIAKHYEIDRVLSDWGIKVLGVFESVSELPDPLTYQGSYGDAYAVKTEEGLVYYIYTRPNANVGTTTNYWLDIGSLSIVGPQGPKGEKGQKGDTGSSTRWFNGNTIPSTSIGGSKVGDYYLNTVNGNVYYYVSEGAGWSLIGNIKGPVGPVGGVGPKGEVGSVGPVGPQGPKGDTGASFQIGGIIARTDLLPTPTEENRHVAYAVGPKSDNTYDMYVVIGTTNLQWANMGIVSGVEGPQGPVGPQGQAGIGAILVATNTLQLTMEQVSTLTSAEVGAINYNNEIFIEQDIRSNEIVFSHMGQSSGVFYSKTLTLNTSTGTMELYTVNTGKNILTYSEMLNSSNQAFINDIKNGLAQNWSIIDNDGYIYIYYQDDGENIYYRSVATFLQNGAYEHEMFMISKSTGLYEDETFDTSGIDVEANPNGNATVELQKLKVGNTTYFMSSGATGQVTQYDYVPENPTATSPSFINVGGVIFALIDTEEE